MLYNECVKHETASPTQQIFILKLVTFLNYIKVYIKFIFGKLLLYNQMSISPLGLLFLPHIRHFLNNLVMDKIYRKTFGYEMGKENLCVP